MTFDASSDDQSLDVIREISPADTMFRGDEEQYYEAGRSALRCLELALQVASKTRVWRILDFPCGYGRVLRALRARFPDAEITACDIDRDAVDFCARVFQARAAYSDPRPERIALEGSFDLIWVGSLFTHLPPDAWGSFLELLHSRLAAGGVLVLTAEGRFVADQLRQGHGRLGLAPDGVSRIVAAYARDGYAFEPYQDKPGYGCFLSSPTWVCRQIERLAHTRLVYYFERGWMERQDVIACARDAQYAGFLDRADASGVAGWAWDALRPESAVAVDVYVDGALHETVEARRHRPDLLAAGIGDGNHGFSFPLPAGAADGREHRIDARISGTTVELKRSPRVVGK